MRMQGTDSSQKKYFSVVLVRNMTSQRKVLVQAPSKVNKLLMQTRLLMLVIKKAEKRGINNKKQKCRYHCFTNQFILEKKVFYQGINRHTKVLVHLHLKVVITKDYT